MIASRIFLRVKRLNIASFSNLPDSINDEHIQKLQRKLEIYDKKGEKFSPKIQERMKMRYSLNPRKQDVDFSALTRQYPKVPAIVEYTTKELGFRPEHIFAALEETPDLGDIALEKWATCFRHLSQYGFTKPNILKMIKDYPGLLHFEENELEDAMHNWMRFQFQESNLLPLLIDYPYFLNLSEKTLDFRICRLREYLEGRRPRVVRLLTNSPQVLFKNWDQVQNVMDYLSEPMRIPKSQISRSGVFRYDLFHLRLRFLFLYKTGVYTIRHFKADPLEPPKHPPLTDIVDSHDEKFVYRVAGLSMIEFTTFKDMLYANEIEDDRDFLKPPDTYGLINKYLVTNLRKPDLKLHKKRPPPQAPVVE